MMRNIPVTAILLVCLSFVGISLTAPVIDKAAETETESRHIRTASKISEELREKLEKLKKVLDDVDLAKSAEKAPAPVTTPATDAKDSRQQSEESSHSQDTELSSQDILLLKSLKGALENIRKGSGKEDRQQVMQTVVSRLLNDLDIALRNGITVEEIIKYLYGTEKAIKDRQQKIQDEEDQLQSLLRQQNQRD